MIIIKINTIIAMIIIFLLFSSDEVGSVLLIGWLDWFGIILLSAIYIFRQDIFVINDSLNIQKSFIHSL
jgi:hypothetical protein